MLTYRPEVNKTDSIMTPFSRATGRPRIIFSPSLKNFLGPASRFGLLAEHRCGIRFPDERSAFLPLLHFVLSGYRESNPDYKTPSLAYYHYTIARCL